MNETLYEDDDVYFSWERIQHGPDALTVVEKMTIVTALLFTVDALSYLTSNAGRWTGAKQVPVRGKHLDQFNWTDIAFITFSRLSVPIFSYQYFDFVWKCPSVLKRMDDITVMNTFVAWVTFFIIYDFFYTILHWFLHIKHVYGYIHKHHHRQMAPTRATLDAINVHPVEFLLGEYNHLLALFLLTKITDVHLITAMVIVFMGGILTGINHTRDDIEIRLFNTTIFDSKHHDVHHRLPQTNYGQYTMFWDHVFGTFRSYNPNERVNPKMQLDPLTGKTYAKKAL